jgi:hypothetical protein
MNLELWKSMEIWIHEAAVFFAAAKSRWWSPHFFPSAGPSKFCDPPREVNLYESMIYDMDLWTVNKSVVYHIYFVLSNNIAFGNLT